MEFDKYIGEDKDFVVKELESLGYTVAVKDNNSRLNEYDKELVVQIEQNNKQLEVITSKFLIEI